MQKMNEEWKLMGFIKGEKLFCRFEWADVCLLVIQS